MRLPAGAAHVDRDDERARAIRLKPPDTGQAQHLLRHGRQGSRRPRAEIGLVVPEPHVLCALGAAAPIAARNRSTGSWSWYTRSVSSMWSRKRW